MLAWQSLQPPVFGLDQFEPLQHFAPNPRSFALASSIETVNLHCSMQERPRTMLSLDCECTAPKLGITRQDGHEII